jgi:hypothetical protein
MQTVGRTWWKDGRWIRGTREEDQKEASEEVRVTLWD